MRRRSSTGGEPVKARRRESDALPEGVRRALAKCEAVFRLQEPKKRMRDKAAPACRARVAEELQRRTRILALSIVGRQQER